MPRASWRGFLRLSLVSCPIYLSPATSPTKPIRLRQVWRPAATGEGEDEALKPARRKELTKPLVPEFGADCRAPGRSRTPLGDAMMPGSQHFPALPDAGTRQRALLDYNGPASVRKRLPES
jgi:hypothetical protein